MSSETSVIYSTDTIVGTLLGGHRLAGQRATACSRDDRPIMIVAPLDALEAIARDFRRDGLRLAVACADDVECIPQRLERVSLGSDSLDGLLSNSFAVITAAKACDAAVILLDGEASKLRCIDSFLALAEESGASVFSRARIGDNPIGWELCTTAKVRANPSNWKTCPSCKLTFDAAAIEFDNYICPACGSYIRESSLERIRQCFDDGAFFEWEIHVEETDPLGFPGYLEKLDALKEKTGLDEAVKTGTANIWGIPFAFGIMDSSFLMGSMGFVVGEKITRMVRRATKYRLPVVIFSASGGARMQEGLVSLMQMAKISCAISEHGDAGLPYFSVLTDPTTGGVTASFAMQGDVIIAEPKALIGFAGRRVIKDTIKQELPEGFQSAEFALEHGLVDMICPRERLRDTLGGLLALHDPEMVVVAEDVSSAGSGRALIEEYYERSSLDELALLRSKYASDDERAVLSASIKERLLDNNMRNESLSKNSGVEENRAWRSVKLARNTKRPTAKHYIEAIADSFIELHGDRMFSDDGAVICGIGSIDGIPVTIVGLEKGTDLRERIARNFGCAQPEGYRKSLRVMRQAEKFGRPVVCIVDTQGAFCGMEAEERGQGNAIADNLLALAGLKVPVVSVVVGEGGSGGALALALADRVAMQENAIYSVLSPEGFASILWKDGSRAPEAASVMKMSAYEIYEMGLIERVLSEGAAAHEEPKEAAVALKEFVVESLRELVQVEPEELVRCRRERFFAF